MVGHRQKLGRKKEQAIAALLSQRGIEEAACAAGIGATTLRRWLRLPEFQAEYLQARRDVVHQVNARIQQNAGAAAVVLLKLMADHTTRSEEHTAELQSLRHLVCRLLLEKKKTTTRRP